MYWTLIWSVLLMNLLACMSPWADFVMIIKNSLWYSRKAWIWTAVWFGMGMLVHIGYCLLGLAVLISNSIVLFSLVKILWWLYLIYIWIQSYLAKDSIQLPLWWDVLKKDMTRFEAVKVWFLTNVLNPKATMFMLAIFTVVIWPETPHRVLWIISVGIVSTIVIWFSLVAIFLTIPSIQERYKKIQMTLNKVFWGILILFWIKVITSK